MVKAKVTMKSMNIAEEVKNSVFTLNYVSENGMHRFNCTAPRCSLVKMLMEITGVSERKAWSIVGVKERRKSPSKAIRRTAMTIGEFTLDEILNLGLNVDSFYMHGNRQWGKVIGEIYRENPTLRYAFEEFHKQYQIVEEMSHHVTYMTKNDMYAPLLELNDLMDSLASNIVKSNVLETHKGEKVIETNGRRLGLREIYTRLMGCKKTFVKHVA